MGRLRHDKPVDSDRVDLLEVGDDENDYESDIYELRNCCHCDTFLPLDKPAKVVGMDRRPCCDGCYELYH